MKVSRLVLSRMYDTYANALYWSETSWTGV